MNNIDFLSLAELQSELNLSSTDFELLKCASTEFFPNVKFKKLDKGVGTAVKVIMKPYTLMPYLIKLDNREKIELEQKGDKLIRLKIPSTNIPALSSHHVIKNRACIVYSYITGERVSDVVDRLDLYLGRVHYDEERHVRSIESNGREQILKEIFDVVLKKCHWLDAAFEMKKVKLPPMSEPLTGFIEDKKVRSELLRLYEKIKNVAHCYSAPHGIIHGDLHPKNILVSRHFDPIIIDFSHVKKSACVFFDYAKLEFWLQFQLKSDFTNQFFNKGLNLRAYSSDPLILPRSHHGVALYIHTIRSILWKTCLSKTVNMSYEVIDIIYRCYLIYFLIRYCLTAKMDKKNREIAFSELTELMYFFDK